MSRRVTYRGLVRLPHGFHTGDGRRLGVTDQPLFREEDGAVALAGTSLAGVLRADLLRLLRECDPESDPGSHAVDCVCVVCRLLGPEAPAERSLDQADRGLRASRLRVSGGTALPVVRVRDHVGIDRRSRAAADRRKYDVEVAEGGIEFPFSLRIDDPEEDALGYVEAFLKRLAQGWLFLGGKSGGGLGRAELAELDRLELDLSAPGCLVEHLLSDEAEAGCSRQVLLAAGNRSWANQWVLPVAGRGAGWAQARLHLDLEFPWGFLVNAPADAAMRGYDHAFARRPDGGPLLPGSALRGALRSRAEQILRTFGGDAAACDLNRKGASCHERIEREREERAKRAGEEEARDLDAELEAHCLACQVFGSGRYASPVKMSDFHPAAGRGGKPRGQELVAIDRFTGGAAAQLKFDAESCDGPRLAGTLDLELGPHRLADWGLGLVALVLRDLLLGDIPLGFATARGFNEYRARITGAEGFWLHVPAALADLGLPLAAGGHGWQPGEEHDLSTPAGVAAAGGQRLAGCCAAWVEALHRRLARVPSAPLTRSKSEEGLR